MKVRLLNPSIYAELNCHKNHPKETCPRDPGSYPVVAYGVVRKVYRDLKEQ